MALLHETASTYQSTAHVEASSTPFCLLLVKEGTDLEQNVKIFRCIALRYATVEWAGKPELDARALCYILWTDSIPVEAACCFRIPRLCLLKAVPPFPFSFRLPDAERTQ
jgi:hypothetical protein